MHKPIRKRVIAYSVVTHTDVPSNGSPCIWQCSASAMYMYMFISDGPELTHKLADMHCTADKKSLTSRIR